MGKNGNEILNDEEFMVMFTKLGATKMSRELNCEVKSIYSRRRRLEERLNVILDSGGAIHRCQYPARVPITLKNGIMMVMSDCHYWPDIISTAHRGFLKLLKELKPEVVVLNGDVLDGASISRHDPIGWEGKPSLKQEKEAVYDRTTEIVKASPKAKHYWTLGNHCQRFENKLAKNASEFKDVEGFTLAHHFPLWEMAMSLWVNNILVIKHRWKGGIHATHNHTVNSGKSFLNGHLHSLKVTPFSDYNGTRFGIDSGTGADPYGPQFSYGEDNPLNHRSGFIVLTFKEGFLMWPEIAAVVDKDHIQFRGELIKV